ncbi:titin-like isoform X2 [Eriocheir sinensis]|uniref:titin-like isoform X2 n=1 Tax=Eriocheir sinensis TaxID=95602 RepID=UPI0021C89FB0|nr:titin-like isoform X2 [Eriocheir sinensis]
MSSVQKKTTRTTKTVTKKTTQQVQSSSSLDQSENVQSSATHNVNNLSIARKGQFFNDSYFEDTRQDFQDAIQDVLAKWGDKSKPANDINSYRELRQRDLRDENQAIKSTEDQRYHKIVIDVKDFIDGGDVSVKTVDEEEIVVEGRVERKVGNTRSTKSFKRTFIFSDMVPESITSVVSADGILIIKALKQDSGMDVSESVTVQKRVVQQQQQSTVQTSDQQAITVASPQPEQQQQTVSVIKKVTSTTTSDSGTPGRVLPIDKRGGFFEDSYFEDCRQHFQKAVKQVLQKSNVTSTQADDIATYRDLRQKDLREETQVATVDDEEQFQKIIVDVKDFLNGGDVTVKTVEEREVVIEGRIERQEGNKKTIKRFCKRFILPEDILVESVTSVVSSDGVLTITAPKKPSETRDTDVSQSVTVQKTVVKKQQTSTVETSGQQGIKQIDIIVKDTESAVASPQPQPEQQQQTVSVIKKVTSTTTSDSGTPGRVLPIDKRGGFFEDSYFEDCRQHFQKAVKQVLQKSNVTSTQADDIATYRDLRQKDLREETQVATVDDEEQFQKIIVDVKDFLNGGEVTVKTVEEREVVIEGRVERQEGNKKIIKRFCKRFILPEDILVESVTSVVSSDGVLTITAPRKPSETQDTDVSQSVTVKKTVVKKQQTSTVETAGQQDVKQIDVQVKETDTTDKKTVTDTQQTTTKTTKTVTITTTKTSFFKETTFVEDVKDFQEAITTIIKKLNLTVIDNDVFTTYRNYRKNNPPKNENQAVSEKDTDTTKKIVIDVSDFENVTVKVVERELVIEGNGKRTTDTGATQTFSFCRRFTLPEDVNPDDITAVVSPEGILIITIIRRRTVKVTQEKDTTDVAKKTTTTKTTKKVTITTSKTSFFNETTFVEDVKDFQEAITTIIKKLNLTVTEDIFTTYRNYRKNNPPKNENQAVSEKETDTTKKIVIDVSDFIGAVTVTVDDRLVIVEGKGNRHTEAGAIQSFSFNRQFILPDDVNPDDVSAVLTTDGILIITIIRRKTVTSVVTKEDTVDKSVTQVKKETTEVKEVEAKKITTTEETKPAPVEEPKKPAPVEEPKKPAPVEEQKVTPTEAPKTTAPVEEPKKPEEPKPAPVEEPKPAPVEEPKPVPVEEPKLVPVEEPKKPEEPKPAPVEEPKPVPVEEPKPVPVEEPKKPEEPKPAPVEEPKPTPVEEPKPVPVEEPKKPEEPKPAPVEEPKPAPVEEPKKPEEPKPAPVEEPKPAPVEEPKKPEEPKPAPVEEAKKPEEPKPAPVEEPKKPEEPKPAPVEEPKITPTEAPKATAPAEEPKKPEEPKPAPAEEPKKPVPVEEPKPAPVEEPKKPAPTEVAKKTTTTKTTKTVTITTTKNTFFKETTFVEDVKDFQEAILTIIKKLNLTITEDVFTTYRNYRKNNPPKNENQAVSEKDTDTTKKIVLDVSDFLENVTVKVVERELVVEGTGKRPNETGAIQTFNFCRRFTLPEDVNPDDISAVISSDGILIITIIRRRTVKVTQDKKDTTDVTKKTTTTKITKKVIITTTKTSFFKETTFVEDVKSFQEAIMTIIKKLNLKVTEDVFTTYRNYRKNNPPKNENQAVSEKETDSTKKIVLDVSDFLEDVTVTVVERELVVEGTGKRPNETGAIQTFNFCRRFTLPEDVNPDDITAVISSDGILIITIIRRRTVKVTQDKKDTTDVTKKTTTTKITKKVIITTIKSSFFKETTFVEDVKSFQEAITTIIKKLKLKVTEDVFTTYRNYRKNNPPKNENQAVSEKETDTTKKIVLDVSDFLEDVTVTVVERELVVEGTGKRPTGSGTFQTFSFNRHFTLPEDVNPDDITAVISSEGILIITIIIRKKQTTTATVVTKTTNKVTIITKGAFFKDQTFVEDVKNYEQAMTTIIKKFNLKVVKDAYTTYRDYRKANPKNENQAVSEKETDKTKKIVIDVSDFSEIVTVSVEERELVIQGEGKRQTAGGAIQTFSFNRHFCMPEGATTDDVTAVKSSEGVLSVTIKKTVTSSVTTTAATSEETGSGKVIKITTKGPFFSDPAFASSIKEFQSSITTIIKKFSVKVTGTDNFTAYRNYRKENPKNENQAVSVNETDTVKKVVMDVMEFVGATTVKVEGKEVVVNGTGKRQKGGKGPVITFSFARRFTLYDDTIIDAITAVMSSEGILIITIPRKN